MAGSERLIVCASAALADGGEGVRFELQRGRETAPAFAIRYEGRVYAYLNRCAHVGGGARLAGGAVFRCRWHRFAMLDARGAVRPDDRRMPGRAVSRRRVIPIPVEEIDGEVVLKEQVRSHG